VVYKGYSAPFMLMDDDSMVCGTHDILLGAGQYIADVQAAQFSDSDKHRNSIKFIMNDNK
jgi:hypothetical protein